MELKQGKPYIIAEAGTSHNGDINRGLELIDAAAYADADCVKFQIVFAEEIIHPGAGMVDLPNGKTPLFKIFREIEADIEFYRQLKSYSEKRGVSFLATPFGLKSALLLKELGTDAVKIASPELNHYPLLKEVSSWDCPVILSTGVSTVSDIEKALSITGDKSVLLHCITSYPAPEEEYNLKTIQTLSALFGVKTGVSDHSQDPMLVPLLSTVLGSVIIEKHITLSNQSRGLDDKIALTPDNFRLMTEAVKEAEDAGAEKTLKKLEKIYGIEKIKRTAGNGVKKLAKSERDNYKTTNRSVMAVKDIKKGEILNHKNTALLRSEKNLIPGLAPDYFDLISGKKAVKDIKSGEGIYLSHIIP